MSTPEEDLKTWILTAGHESLSVTAFNPANGKSKKLEPSELKDLLKLLVAYDAGLRRRAGLGGAAQSQWDAEEGRAFAGEFAALGLDRAWYETKTPENAPLFHIDGKPGHALCDLLAAARAAGRLKLNLPAEMSFSRPEEKLVFIIDDDDSLREMTSYLFRKEGFQVDIFPNGVEALNAIHHMLPDRMPDLIILDLMMPIQGGFEVLRELQASEASRVPIIVITGRNLDSKMADTLRREPNVVEFMSKPVHPQKMITAAHTHLKTKRALG